MCVREGGGVSLGERERWRKGGREIDEGGREDRRMREGEGGERDGEIGRAHV